MAAHVARGEDLWAGDPQRGRRAVSGFTWPELVPAYDDELEQLANRQQQR
jgi:hypothetical protein